MTAWEYLGFFADFYGVPHKEERMALLLKAVDLFDRRHSYLREFSRGMQQKASLARALLHDAGLLLLDEPTSGLDPYGIKQVRDLLLAERDRGKTILISSHILSEVERTADRVGILAGGELQAQDTVARLIEGTRDHVAVDIELSQEVPGLADRLQALPFVREVEVQGAGLVVSLPATEQREHNAALFSAIAAQGGTIVQMTSRKRTLEDAFLTLTESGALAWAQKDAGATCSGKQESS
jgi:ABC-2 type transport system ATP-binding protein